MIFFWRLQFLKIAVESPRLISPLPSSMGGARHITPGWANIQGNLSAREGMRQRSERVTAGLGVARPSPRGLRTLAAAKGRPETDPLRKVAREEDVARGDDGWRARRKSAPPPRTRVWDTTSTSRGTTPAVTARTAAEISRRPPLRRPQRRTTRGSGCPHGPSRRASPVQRTWPAK